MAFELGMFEEFWRRKAQTEEGAFRDAFAQIDAGERYGLDVCWLAELHVNPDRSVLSATAGSRSATPGHRSVTPGHRSATPQVRSVRPRNRSVTPG